jgi:hypothetical protein
MGNLDQRPGTDSTLARTYEQRFESHTISERWISEKSRSVLHQKMSPGRICLLSVIIITDRAWRIHGVCLHACTVPHVAGCSPLCPSVFGLTQMSHLSRDRRFDGVSHDVKHNLSEHADVLNALGPQGKPRNTSPARNGLSARQI